MQENNQLTYLSRGSCREICGKISKPVLMLVGQRDEAIEIMQQRPWGVDFRGRLQCTWFPCMEARQKCGTAQELWWGQLDRSLEHTQMAKEANVFIIHYVHNEHSLHNEQSLQLFKADRENWHTKQGMRVERLGSDIVFDVCFPPLLLIPRNLTFWKHVNKQFTLSSKSLFA